MERKSIEAVREFWNNNPLWTGESKFEAGTREFFEEHRQVYVADCFAGRLDERLFPEDAKLGRVLDLGCGVGFWIVEFGRRGYREIHGADLTANSLALARRRAAIYDVNVTLHEQDAERMGFADAYFDHVNCLGVIHHTPNPSQAVAEIARVLKPGGTACISVYYRNAIIRNWGLFSRLSKMIGRRGARLEGRGREGIYFENSVEEVIRQYDGKDNPIGIGFTREQFVALLSPSFQVVEIFHHFFPARTLPHGIPSWLHRVLDTRLPFMIYASLRRV